MIAYQPLISIIVLSYNNAAYIVDCLDHVYNQTFQNFEVIAVDNNSSDNSVKLFQRYPLRLVANKINVGGSMGYNTGLKRARGKYILLLDTDTRMRKNTLALLYDYMETHPQVGAVMGKLVFENSNRINSAGNAMNILGHTWCAGLNEEDYGQYATRLVSSVSGACFFARQDAFERVGEFDADMFLYNEDADISLRFLMHGYKLAFLNQAVIEHHYSVTVNKKVKYYYIERNRWIILLKNYSLSTLLVLFAPLLLQELGILIFLASQGMLWEKIRGYGWIMRQLPRTLKKRRLIQKTRTVSDRELLPLLETTFDYADIQNPFVKYVLNPITRSYAKLILSNRSRVHVDHLPRS